MRRSRGVRRRWGLPTIPWRRVGEFALLTGVCAVACALACSRALFGPHTVGSPAGLSTGQALRFLGAAALYGGALGAILTAHRSKVTSRLLALLAASVPVLVVQGASDVGWGGVCVGLSLGLWGAWIVGSGHDARQQALTQTEADERRALTPLKRRPERKVRLIEDPRGCRSEFPGTGDDGHATNARLP